MHNDEVQQTITQYYNELAKGYDADRFGNSYGQYLHRQEHRLLQRWLRNKGEPVVSLGCGTGRLMELATHGADISPAMITEASRKCPDKTFTVCPATDTTYADAFFEAAFCLHLLMHLPTDTIAEILAEANRIVKPDGWLIVDYPNGRRRQLVKPKEAGWHGNTSFTVQTFQQLAAQQGWQLQQYSGVLLFPVHRLPRWLRPLLLPIDTWLCHSPLKKYASYHLVLLQKRGGG